MNADTGVPDIRPRTLPAERAAERARPTAWPALLAHDSRLRERLAALDGVRRRNEPRSGLPDLVLGPRAAETREDRPRSRRRALYWADAGRGGGRPASAISVARTRRRRIAGGAAVRPGDGSDQGPRAGARALSPHRRRQRDARRRRRRACKAISFVSAIGPPATVRRDRVDRRRGRRHACTFRRPGAVRPRSKREPTVLLDQAYELDDAPRWERFYFVTGDAPFEAAPVVQAARGPRRTRRHAACRARRCRADLEQTGFTLQKESRP